MTSVRKPETACELKEKLLELVKLTPEFINAYAINPVTKSIYFPIAEAHRHQSFDVLHSLASYLGAVVDGYEDTLLFEGSSAFDEMKKILNDVKSLYDIWFSQQQNETYVGAYFKR